MKSSVITVKTSSAQAAPLARDMGQNIVVLDRGFVYVGNVTFDGDFLRITECRNLRKWGTSSGLGELRNGPLPGTTLDQVGEVLAPMHSLIHLIPCNGF